MNQAAISGNLTRDPEVFEGDLTRVKCGVAWTENKKVGDEWQEKPHFFDFTIFGGKADVFARKAKQGDLVTVSGRLDFHAYEKDDGTKGSKVSILANEVDGEWKYRKNEQAATAELPVDNQTSQAVATDDDIPF